MKYCTGIACPMQHGVVDPATCAAVNYCKYATPPITNADRIRAMSDEELAAFLTDDFCEMLGCESPCDGHCDRRMLEWLKQEEK